MKKTIHLMAGLASLAILPMSCDEPKALEVQVFETSAGGNQLAEVSTISPKEEVVEITILPDEKYQEITGFGGSFTEASAHLLNQLSDEKRKEVIEGYFGDSGARYSLTRTHISSCDFSLGNYTYAPIAGDTALAAFSIDEDRADLLPMIKDAQAASTAGFKIIASPWTAPPWMKDNQDWKGGKLLPEYQPTWALFFDKYLDAYQKEGINIWGITVENEPLGNDSNWESMHFSPEEMNVFVKNHLGPKLADRSSPVKILGYDQNRDEELKEWADAMYDEPEMAGFYDGMAVHWYGSTYDYFPQMLQYTHKKAPGKHLIQSEACIDAQVPRWKDDAWYWSKEATDWGWDWAPDDKKHLHPKYVPAFRYARDMIGCLNNWVDGWVDWNMVLDRQGGPNWAKNWCTAPVIVDPERDEVYFTPLYYVISHFSKFIRPGAVRIGHQSSGAEGFMVTAAQNPDGSLAVVVFNPAAVAKTVRLTLGTETVDFPISAKAIQSVVVAQ